MISLVVCHKAFPHPQLYLNILPNNFINCLVELESMPNKVTNTKKLDKGGIRGRSPGGHPQSKEGVCRLGPRATANKMHLSYSSSKSYTSAAKHTCKIQLDNRR